MSKPGPESLTVHACLCTAESLVSSVCVQLRNPCYHPGDVRVLEAVELPHLNHLKDCIVFPVQVRALNMPSESCSFRCNSVRGLHMPITSIIYSQELTHTY